MPKLAGSEERRDDHMGHTWWVPASVDNSDIVEDSDAVKLT